MLLIWIENKFGKFSLNYKNLKNHNCIETTFEISKFCLNFWNLRQKLTNCWLIWWHFFSLNLSKQYSWDTKLRKTFFCWLLSWIYMSLEFGLKETLISESNHIKANIICLMISQNCLVTIFLLLLLYRILWSKLMFNFRIKQNIIIIHLYLFRMYFQFK